MSCARQYAESATRVRPNRAFAPDLAGTAPGPPIAPSGGMTTTQDQPVFTFGVHYFCDHRCWRCVLRDRCAVCARWTQATNRKSAVFSGPGGRVASVLAVSLDVTMEEAMVMAGEAAKNMPAAQSAACGPALRRRRQEPPIGHAERDPLVARGGEYAQCVVDQCALLDLRAALGDDDQARAIGADDRCGVGARDHGVRPRACAARLPPPGRGR